MVYCRVWYMINTDLFEVDTIYYMITYYMINTDLFEVNQMFNSGHAEVHEPKVIPTERGHERGQGKERRRIGEEEGKERGRRGEGEVKER